VVAGIVNATTITGSTLQNSSTNPRTSINPDGSLSVTNSGGTVIFKLAPDGTMFWYTGTGVLMMELEPGGTTLIYASATGPTGWDFEGSTNSWVANSAAISDSATWSWTGNDSLKITANGSSVWGATSPAFSVVALTTASMQCQIFTPAALSALSIGFTFWSGANGTGSNLGTVTGDQGTFATSAGEVAQVTITGASVPAGALSATFHISEAHADASGTLLYIDSVNVAGGLIYSNSPVPGTDTMGNDFDQGINFIGLPGLTNVFGVEDPYGNQLAAIDGGGNAGFQLVTANDDVVLDGLSLAGLLFGLSNPDPWHPMALINNWVSGAAGNAYPVYRLGNADPVVYLTGVINGTSRSGTTGGSNAVFAQLPAGYFNPNTQVQSPISGALVSSPANLPYLQCDTSGYLSIIGIPGGGAAAQYELGNTLPIDAPNNPTTGSSTGGNLTTHTTTWTAANTYAYQGSNADSSPNPSNPLARINIDQKLYQGDDATGNNGSTSTFITWPAAVATALSGATIKSAVLYLQNRHTFWSTGMNYSFGYTTASVTGGGTRATITNPSLVAGSTLEGSKHGYDLFAANSAFGTALQNGYAFVLYIANASRNFYGYGDGAGQSVPPSITVTYVK
jgi:hypothetical protein